MKIKVHRRVSLTPRDYFLLEELYENVVLSFPQVWRKVFEGRAKATALNRLARLEAMDFISRWKVPRLKAGCAGGEILVVFQVTRKGIRALEKWQPGKEYRERPLGLNGYSLLHDVLLVDVMDVLRGKIPGSKVTNASLLPPREEANVVQPDAVIELAEGRERWAVELELTAKTERRYREIVLRYRLDRAFTRVLYVLEMPRVENKLARVLGTKPGRLSLNPPTEKFLCVYLAELFPQPKGEPRMETKTINNKNGETAA